MPASRLMLLVALVLVFETGVAGTLLVNINYADPTPRAAWESAFARFGRENPDVRLEVNWYDHESYKKAIRNWLTSAPPDVVFWFAGARMRQFVGPGLLEDVSDVFTPEVRRALHPSAVDLVSAGGRQYGVPYTFYQIGIYYRRDVLAAAGFTEAPRTWTELLGACDALRAKGIVPIAIGTKDLWPAAAWFDYLDLRTNGLAFHRDLMEGRVPYTDPRVRAVLARWRELLARQCFAGNHASSTWQESQALLYRGEAAMMLIGNYIVANFPADVRERMDFAPFPVVDPGIGRFEDAPMNTVHVPARARNKSDGKRLLAFLLRADVQEELNAKLVQIPVNRHAAVPVDRFLAAGARLVANADGFMQFFDRDTPEDLANVAMKGFQEFMIYPDRAGAVLDTIERARGRVFEIRSQGAALR